MRTDPLRNSIIAALLVLAPALRPVLAHAAPLGTEKAELDDRDVDEAALTAQDKAAAELSALLKKYRGTPKEPLFLQKLAEIYQQSGAMEFRVAHGQAERLHKPVDLRTYKKVMSRSIEPLNELISRFPDYQDLAHAWFMRGKAYEESGDKAAATRDYQYLTRVYATAPEAVPANMSLADFAIDADHYSEAISYLKAVERQPDDEHYPVALYKQSWCYYNLKDTRDALGTAERLVGYYHARAPKSPGGKLPSSEQAMMENMLHDVPLFYFQGHELKDPEYAIQKTLPYFRRLTLGSSAIYGPIYGRMLIQYTTLLRVHGYEHDLGTWKDTVLAEEPRRPESLEVLMTTYEFQYHQRRYPDLVKTAGDIVTYYKRNGRNEYSAKAESLLLETATSLQKLMLDNRNHGSSDMILAQWLAPIYGAFTQIVSSSDPRLRAIHANLAETLFAIKDYENAAQAYRWIVQHYSWSSEKDKAGGITVAEASLRSISSRYEYLRTKNLVPGELKAVPVPAKDVKELNPLLTEWIGWVDAHARHVGMPDNFANFAFEANRIMYAQGQVNEATDRMKSFALRNPKSSFALPAATLVVDTVIASQDWERLEKLANQFLKVEEWRGSSFNQRLYKTAADAKYKRVDQLVKNKDYKDALTQANEFAAHYGSSEHFADTLTLAGNSAAALHNRSLAIQYYARLAQSTKNTPTSANAMLAMARLEEERYSFTAAANDYLAYMAMPKKITHLEASKEHALKKRVLVLSWLSGDAHQLNRMLANRSICDRSLGAECDRFHALTMLMGSNQISPRLSMQAVRLAQSASPEVRPIYAAIALENAGHLSTDMRHRMIRELSDSWHRMDGMARFSLISRISVSVPYSFTLDRQAIERSGRLRADERSLTRRLNLIRDMEASATIAAKLPWSRIRVLVLDEMAWVYNDLSDGIRRLSPPRRQNARERLVYQRSVDQMVAPFDAKAQQIRGEAYRLASTNGVESEVYDRVSADFVSASARGQQSAAVAPRQGGTSHQVIDVSLVRSVDNNGSWRPVDLDTAEPAQILRAKWAEAIEGRQWAQVAFFAEEAREKGLLSPEVTGVAQAVSIASAGARAEGVMELTDLCRSHRSSRLGDACRLTRYN